MELLLDILIPSGVNIPGILFKEPLFEWQGESYAQGPPEASFGTNYKLVCTQVHSFVQQNIPATYAAIQWQHVSVKGPGLDLYTTKLRMDVPDDEEPEDPEEQNYKLTDLLHAMCAGNKWIIVIDNDEPFEVMPAGSLSHVISALNDVIKGNISENGFLICGEGSE